MRVLIIHNRYQQKGGEDTTFEQETELLGQTEEVKTLVFQNHAGWRGAIQFFLSIWNVFSANRIRKAAVAFRPDLIHVHNWHYAVGPIGVRTAHKMKIPVVLTVQNFRLLCPSATLLYKDELFLDSIHASFPWKAIGKKLYRNSWLQTFWLSFIIWVHKKAGTWKMVNKYILQTELAREIFISSSLGTDEDQFIVKPNFIKDPGEFPIEREDFFLYIGRISSEKGIGVLVEAFHDKPCELIVGGDGPLKEEVIFAAEKNSRIHYAGLLDKQKVMDLMRRCSALVFPSIWYEGMPLTLIEAFATGTPVIASNLGAMSSMILDGYNGFHFTAGSAAGLSDRIEYWSTADTMTKKEFSRNARICFEKLYTPEKNREKLLSIYQAAIKNGSTR
jgi:glycosyltransferase involved in cell wall biosynthesis